MDIILYSAYLIVAAATLAFTIRTWYSAPTNLPWYGHVLGVIFLIFISAVWPIYLSIELIYWVKHRE